jgi:membrane protease YdiL (CAAX protease family)
MAWTVAVVGTLAQVVAWRLVTRDRVPFWPATIGVFAVLGIASILVGEPTCCRDVAAATAAGVGAASGLLLYGATRLVVGAAGRDAALGARVLEIYRRSDEVRFASAVALTMAVAVPGEELFWRGLVLSELTAETSVAVGALAAWAAAVVVSVAWGSLALFAGTVVGGALWTGLAVWTGGLVAPIASHLVWTALMLVWPPRAARGKVPR